MTKTVIRKICVYRSGAAQHPVASPERYKLRASRVMKVPLMPKSLFLALALALPALPGIARAEGPSLLRQAAISAELYSKGVESGDPLLILAAAQLRKSLDLQPLAPGQSGSTETGNFAPTSWEDMVAAAVALTAGDDPLRGLAEDVAAQTWKGVISGPVYRIEKLGPGGEARLPDLSFRGGEYAEVYAEAEPGLDVNVAVYDEEGRLVCSDNHPSHVAYCGWTPAVDGHFTLVVGNSASREAHFALMTN